MALILGLESIQPSKQDQIYTLSDVLEAELECMDAQQALTDYINFNEILFSVRKYTSQECVDFAAGLLGTDAVSLEAAANTDNTDEVKKGFGERIKAAWDKLFALIKKFFGWLKQVISNFFKSISRSANSKPGTISLVSKVGMARLASQSEALQYEKQNIKVIEEKIKNYSALFDKETASKAEYTETDPIKQHLRMIERIYGNIYITATNIDAIFKANGPVKNRKTANQAAVIATVNKSFNSLNKKVVNFIRAELNAIRQGSSGFSFRSNERTDEANKTDQYVNAKEKEINNLEVNKK